MRHITATDGRLQFARLVDEARVEPVLVQRNGRPVAAMVSYGDFLRLREVFTKDFLNLCDRVRGTAETRGLTPETLTLLLVDD